MWSDASTVTYDSSELYWASTNRLGVGTGSPGGKLEVENSLTAPAILVDQNATGSYAGIQIESEASSPQGC